jgi:hypothetical protein
VQQAQVFGKKAGLVINLKLVLCYRVLGFGKTIVFICPLLRQALER